MGVRELTVMRADTFFLRLRGLLGRDVRDVGGLLITPCNQIHTCFMGYPIDVAYLDNVGRVVRVDEDVAPWRFCKAERAAKQVVELPANHARELGIRVGDILRCRPPH